METFALRPTLAENALDFAASFQAEPTVLVVVDFIRQILDQGSPEVDVEPLKSVADSVNRERFGREVDAVCDAFVPFSGQFGDVGALVFGGVLLVVDVGSAWNQKSVEFFCELGIFLWTFCVPLC